MVDLNASIQYTIRGSLDGLVSARSSPAERTQSLDELERLLARTLAPDTDSSLSSLFQFLQDTFECNIPTRLVDWISTASLRLDHLINRGISDSEKGSESAILSGQLVQALSLMQGVALVHHRSKSFLGRKYALEVLVDLLWVSRHCGGPNSESSPVTDLGVPNSKPKTTVSLASAVLDTLLCILVDSSPALRVFENVNGVQTVVKLLKRPKALRDVKMKCLEFLYFYLLDETKQVDAVAPALPAVPLSPSPFTESRPGDRRRSFRDASWGSDDSRSSTSSRSSSSDMSTSSSATSMSSSSTVLKPTSPTSPRHMTPRRPSARPRSLLLLQRDVDFVPISPKKTHITRLGVSSSRVGTPLKAAFKVDPETPQRATSESNSERTHETNADGTRTMGQKKAYLGTMLGNVDALVAGVRNAGVAFT